LGILEGRAAIVTGAAQGLGLSISKRFLEQGARVLMADLQKEKLQVAASALGDAGNAVHACPVDVTSSGSVAEMVAQAAVVFEGRVDILVNVAGGSGTTAVERVEDMSDEIWRRVIDINLNGTFHCCRAAAPYLRRSAGRIINFSSGSLRGVTGRSTIAARHAYGAAKAAIHGLSNQLAIDLAADGARVYVMLPGFVLTEPGARVRELFDRLSPEDRAGMLERMKEAPRRPEDIAWAVAFLASERAVGASGAGVKLSGPIHDANLRLVPEAPTPLGSLARLEAATD
jgi:NAD(P)-dependent dehydrogenase (short-subunit alcohol dehydrogenase family)